MHLLFVPLPLDQQQDMNQNCIINSSNYIHTGDHAMNRLHSQFPIPPDCSDPILPLTFQCGSTENLFCLPNYTRAAAKQQKGDKYSLWQVFSSNLLKMDKKKKKKHTEIHYLALTMS